MIFYPNNEKIEKYLNELANEYKELLYKALISRSKSLDNLSVSELLRLDNEIKKPLLEDYQQEKKHIKKFLMLGLSYIFLGLTMYFCHMILHNSYNIISLMSLVFAILGILIIFLSFIFYTLKLSNKKTINKTKDTTPEMLKYEIIIKWRELEGIANDISINKNLQTPRSIISFFLNNHFINEEEYFFLKEFLRIRNTVVHSDSYSLSLDETKKLIDKINEIIYKLNKIV